MNGLLEKVGKKVNTPSTLSIMAIVLVILLQTGVIGPTRLAPVVVAVSKEQVEDILNPLSARIYADNERSDAVQRDIVVALQALAENNARTSIILQQIQEELKEIRQSKTTP